MNVESVTTIAASCTVVACAVATFTVKGLKAFARVERALAVVDGRSKQLEANGGASLFDGFRRLETKVDRLSEDVVTVRERTAVVESTANKSAHDVANVRRSLDGLVLSLPRRTGDQSQPNDTQENR